jgi:Transposase DDE domain
MTHLVLPEFVVQAAGAGQGAIRQRAPMTDLRIDKRGQWFIDSIVERHTLALKALGAGRAGEVALNRFLGHDDVSPATVLAPAVARTQRAAEGLSVVVAQDTTEVNFAGRAKRRRDLGPGGDGVSPGFFIHPQIVIDAASEAVIGIAGAEIWTREVEKVGDRRSRSLDEKESRRWIDGAKTAAEVLAGAARIISVGDRESDIYSHFAGKPANADLIVRAAQDRALDDGGRVKSAGADWPLLAAMTVEVAARPASAKGGARAARSARVEVRAGAITICRPKGRPANAGEPESVTLGLVIAREVACPAGAEPLLWRLLTTLPVTTAHQACEVVRLYRLRWRIEEVFRVLKKDGLDVEASQVTEAHRLFNLAAGGLAASVRILQLVDARDGSTRPATDVIEACEIDAIAAIGSTLEGGTKRQQNPWTPGSLAWLAWVVARLGGWNCYYRPPGPKTFAQGWRRLADRLEGFAAATHHRTPLNIAPAIRGRT